MLIFIYSILILAFACYLLYTISDPLENVGGRIGKLLNMPESAISSTLQALATSGPEIVMSIIVATPFIANEIWSTLELGERASSGALNMAFSAMDNLLGIGAVAMIFMLKTGQVKYNEIIKVEPSTFISLGFYVISSGIFTFFLFDNILTYHESIFMMFIGILYVLSQFIAPLFQKQQKDIDSINILKEPIKWSKSFTTNIFIYSALVFALIIFVRECLTATFNMATVSIFSVGGILIMFTSYVSSFPEFMLSYRYVIKHKRNELLSMLFGSNIIDLAFSGFRSIWLKTDLNVYTTGIFPQLLNIYIALLPTIALFLLISLLIKKMKWGWSYYLVVFYLMYIISGFILL